MKLKDIKLNENNPRFIKDNAFEKLKKSISTHSKFMKLRPIIVDENNIIIGGNMRYRALIDLGYKEIPDEWVKKANDLSDEERKAFIIKDNLAFGEWDFDILESEWDKNELDQWGLEIPVYDLGLDVNNMTDDDVDINEEFDPIGVSDGLQRVVFIFNNKDEAEKYLKSINVTNYSKKGAAWQVNMSTLYT